MAVAIGHGTSIKYPDYWFNLEMNFFLFGLPSRGTTAVAPWKADIQAKCSEPRL